MSTELDFQELNKHIDKISKQCEVFSSPIRTLIASLVNANQGLTWKQIKDAVEQITGNPINPNTLGFHIGRLVEMEIVEKAGTKEQPIYRIIKVNVPEALNDPFIYGILQRRVEQ
jgi:hypothetical protein